MKEYKSSLGNSFILRFYRHFFAFKLIAFLSLFPMIREVLVSIWEVGLPVLILGYLFFTILYLGIFNHDFIFKDDKIKIRSSLFWFKKSNEIKYDSIKKVKIKSELNCPENGIYGVLSFFFLIFFPFDYKWIKVTTHTNETFTFYCFGMDYDCYDNCDENDLMENIFREFVGQGINTEWTKSNDDYFDRMTRDAKMKYRERQTY